MLILSEGRVPRVPRGPNTVLHQGLAELGLANYIHAAPVIDHNLPRSSFFSTVDNQSLRHSANLFASHESTREALSLTAVLLAGGQSRRMGSDKALIRCPAGERLWSRQLRLLTSLQPECTWISARTIPTWRPSGIEVVLDAAPSRGPLSGICACLARLETTHLLVLAVDMPRMTADHLRKLRGLTQPRRSLIPLDGDWFEPLCAIYSQSAESTAAACLAGTDNSLQRLARRLVEEQLATPYSLSAVEKSLYLNVNRPDDLSATTR